MGASNTVWLLMENKEKTIWDLRKLVIITSGCVIEVVTNWVSMVFAFWYEKQLLED
jgi:uncharacterized membrane protein